MVDFESRIPPGDWQFYFVYRGNVRGTGSGFELPAESGNRFGGSFGNRFNVAVRQIPNTTHDARIASCAGHEVTKAHTLDSSPYYESPCDHNDETQASQVCSTGSCGRTNRLEADLKTVFLGSGKKVVGAIGFEPTTSRSRTERSTRLSHAPYCDYS